MKKSLQSHYKCTVLAFNYKQSSLHFLSGKGEFNIPHCISGSRHMIYLPSLVLCPEITKLMLPQVLVTLWLEMLAHLLPARMRMKSQLESTPTYWWSRRTKPNRLSLIFWRGKNKVKIRYLSHASQNGNIPLKKKTKQKNTQTKNPTNKNPPALPQHFNTVLGSFVLPSFQFLSFRIIQCNRFVL